MLQFVKNKLKDANALKPGNQYHKFRDRYEHSRRVYNWMLKILPDCYDCNQEVALTAAIFHDVGYSISKENHANTSALIFKEYAIEHGFDDGFINDVMDIISLHSNKELLNDPNIKDELILLLEADLLDEEGCLGITWDLLARGARGITSYKEGLDALYIHSGHILNQDYMITPIAKEIWEHKKEIVRNFINELTNDLFIEEDSYE